MMTSYFVFRSTVVVVAAAAGMEATAVAVIHSMADVGPVHHQMKSCFVPLVG